MVLVEIGQAVIKIDRGADIVGNGKLKGADICFVDGYAIGRSGGVDSGSPLRADRTVCSPELRRNLVLWDRSERTCCGARAVCIVDD